MKQINAVLFWLISVLNEKKKLCICVEIQIFECTVKLKCAPKAVTNIQLSVSQANTALPGPAKSRILSFRIYFSLLSSVLDKQDNAVLR